MPKIVTRGAKRGSNYLHGLDDKVAACLGDHHPWPQVRPGKLPKGVRAVPQADGCYRDQGDLPQLRAGADQDNPAQGRL